MRVVPPLRVAVLRETLKRLGDAEPLITQTARPRTSSPPTGPRRSPATSRPSSVSALRSARERRGCVPSPTR